MSPSLGSISDNFFQCYLQFINSYFSCISSVVHSSLLSSFNNFYFSFLQGSIWFLLKAPWSLHQASQCLFIWKSILYLFNQAKPIPNNGYVYGLWASPHLFIVSIPPHDVSAFFQASWSLIVCSLLDLNLQCPQA